jgi:hypothetical protein
MWTNENRAKYNRDYLRYSSDLTDDEWALGEPFIPPPKPREDPRTGACFVERLVRPRT